MMMRLAFMSSVCPTMTVAELIAAAKKHGYQGIEFRPEWKHPHGVELTATAQERKAVRKQMADAGLESCCIAPSIAFNFEDRAERDRHLGRLFQYIDLAVDTATPRLRVFGDPLPNGGAGRRSNNYTQQAEYLSKAAVRAAEAGVRLCLEVHGTMRAFDAGEILYRAAYPPALWINWHLFHCLNHGEDIDEAYRHVKGRVGHAHFAVGISEVDTFDAVFRQAQLLSAERFDGFFSVEHINPPDSGASLASHAEAWRKILAGLKR
jgi:sugar phosphate isomerase/epimerase